jgi:hypothetical protein
MATLDDILTAQKNGVVAVNTLNQTWLNYARREYGDVTSQCVTAKTLITTGSGYAATFSVVNAGTTFGYIYDVASPDNPPESARLVAILKDEGVYRADSKFDNGLLIVPGTGHAVTVTYSLD